MGCNQTKQPKKIVINEEEKQRLERVTSKENIYKIYEFGTILGSGGFGTVKIVNPKAKTDNKKRFAVKIIPKVKVEKKLHLLLRELEILKTLDHPNIIKFHEIYEDSQNFYIVQELCNGGELLKKITSKHYKFTERDVANVMSKVISAICHMHAKGIVHRDLKPENILLSGKEKNAEIKLIDFGLSNKFRQKDRLRTMVGTPLYVSPQVLQGKYTERCDEWSLGVILYILLVGYPPFYANTKDGIFRAIEQGRYEMSGPDWKNISEDAKDLVRKLLEVDERKRIKVVDAAQHPFFKILEADHHSANSLGEDQEKEQHQNILNLLTHYKTKSRFADEVMKLIVNQMTEKEIQDLTKEFAVLDTEKTGLLSVATIKEAMLKFGVFQIDPNLSEEKKKIKEKELDEQIEHTFDELGYWEYDHLDPAEVEKHENPEAKKNRKIQYTQFLASTLEFHNHLTEQKLYSIFKYCDSSQNDIITVQDLHHIFERHGRNISMDEIKKMVDQVDPNHDGKITWKEFKKIMTGETLQERIKTHDNGHL